MAGAVFPHGLVRVLATVMAGGEGCARARPALRQQAHALGRGALRLVDGHLRDAEQLLLVGAAWQEVAPQLLACCRLP